MSLISELTRYQQRTEQQFIAYFDDRQGIEPRLWEAMHYSLGGGGKRIRPALVYLACRLCGGDEANADAPAAAIEALHTYSLVHDDLPAMDDDELRRGRPTCHIAYDEPTAILVGDALQCLAFEWLTADNSPLSALQQRECVRILARAGGASGMVMGQAFDLAHVNQPLTLEQLKAMHAHKTGALIIAALELGACAAGETDANSAARRQLREFGELIGLAFQIKDDLLDVESTTEVLGKPQGSDEAHNKPTYTSLLGLEKAHQLLNDLEQQAVDLLVPYGDKGKGLRELTAYIVNRDH